MAELRADVADLMAATVAEAATLVMLGMLRGTPATAATVETRTLLETALPEIAANLLGITGPATMAEAGATTCFLSLMFSTF